MDSSSKRTPLYQDHLDSGAKMVPFAGFSMPLQYGGVVSEVSSVRNDVGIFDVSHMGRVEFSGEDASTLLDFVLSCDVAKMDIFSGKYNLICDADGGIVDDCIVYRLDQHKYLLIINAARHSVDLNWILDQKKQLGCTAVEIDDITSESALIAIQGQNAEKLFENVSPELATQLSQIKRFSISNVKITDFNVQIARTGYTGEDGFEMVCSKKDASKLWQMLIKFGATPCGLAARDVLRLEAGLILYGNDVDQSINPYEAGLGWTVKLGKEANYLPREALSKLSTKKSRLLGLEIDQGIPRSGMSVTKLNSDEKVGLVKSGTYSPTIKKGIALAMFDEHFEVGDEFNLDLRGKKAVAKVVKPPFIK